MITIFRRVREKLIGEGKASRYLLYAVGEILLVVIGILIALQVNNWNQERISQIDEQKILADLKTEFEASKEEFRATIRANELKLNAVNILFSQTGSKWDGKLARHQSDSLINSLTWNPDADISTTYLDQVHSTGKIMIINNDELRYRLSNWGNLLADRKFSNENRSIQLINERIIPFLEKHYSLYLSSMRRLVSEGSGFSFDYSLIYQNMEFENILISRAENIGRSMRSYELLVGKADEIIRLINKELDS